MSNYISFATEYTLQVEYYNPKLIASKENKSKSVDDSISVIIDGKKLIFDQEPIIYNSRTLVPLRAIFEELDANITWYDSTKTVIATRDNLEISLQINNPIMKINNTEYLLDVPAQLINGKTLVPIRAISEAFDSIVNWNPDTKTIEIVTTKDISLSLSNGKTIETNWDINELVKEMGEPNRKEISIYGLEWYVYNSDYKNFVMIAIDNNKVCGFYTNSKGFSVSNGIYYGGPSNIDYDKLANVEIKPYIDKSNNTYHGILAVLKNHKYDIDTNSKEFLYIQSLENFDVTNAFRANYDLKELLWDENASIAATKHSQDMADQNYFSHTSLDGKEPIDRYLDIKKVNYRSWGENISAGRNYGIDNFDGWLNSSGHRQNMLSAYPRYLGVGSGSNKNSKYNYYMTQFFINY